MTQLTRGETVVLDRSNAHFAFTDPEVREKYLELAEQSNRSPLQYVIATPRTYRAMMRLLFTPGERRLLRRQWAHRKWARRKPKWVNGRLRAR